MSDLETRNPRLSSSLLDLKPTDQENTHEDEKTYQVDILVEQVRHRPEDGKDPGVTGRQHPGGELIEIKSDSIRITAGAHVGHMLRCQYVIQEEVRVGLRSSPATLTWEDLHEAPCEQCHQIVPRWQLVTTIGTRERLRNIPKRIEQELCLDCATRKQSRTSGKVNDTNRVEISITLLEHLINRKEQ